MEAKASAKSIRMIGAANAVALEALGSAEAEGVIGRANAFSHFTDASKLASSLKALPTIAAQIAQPLANTKEIFILSGNDANSTGIDEYVETAKALFGIALPDNVMEKFTSVQVNNTALGSLNTKIGIDSGRL